MGFVPISGALPWSWLDQQLILVWRHLVEAPPCPPDPPDLPDPPDSSFRTSVGKVQKMWVLEDIAHFFAWMRGVTALPSTSNRFNQYSVLIFRDHSHSHQTLPVIFQNSMSFCTVVVSCVYICVCVSLPISRSWWVSTQWWWSVRSGWLWLPSFVTTCRMLCSLPQLLQHLFDLIRFV